MVLLPRIGAAATFDEQTGKLVLDPTAALAVSFDDASSIPTALEIAFSNAKGESVNPEFVTDVSGLEGSGSLSFGGTSVRADLSLSSLSALVGRRVEFRFWQQSQGTRAQAGIVWGIGDNPDTFTLFGIVTLQPTGQATDDGWIEYGSGPLDFAFSGTLGPAGMYFTDIQYEGGDYTTPDDTARVLIDAFEVLDLGPAAVPTADCSVTDETTTCGPHGLCMFGRCVDAAIAVGQVLQDDDIRSDYLARRITEYRLFEGGRIPQSHMDELEAQLTALESATAATFWPGFQAGIETLWDGHAYPATMGYATFIGTNLGICAHWGEADLLPSVSMAPLVFTTTTSNPVASQLQPGDALVAIDGQPPYHWAIHAARLINYNGDPQGFAQVIAPDLLGAAIQTGATVTFARCPPSGPEPTSCSANQVQNITIDFATLVGDELFAGNVPTWYEDHAACDYRFTRAIDHASVTESNFAGYVDEGSIRTLLINAVPSYYETGGQAWFDAVYGAVSTAPTLLILDQRTGHGGSITTVDYLMGMLVKSTDFDRMEIIPSLDRPLDATLWTAFDNCGGGMWTSSVCGGYYPWPLGEVSGLDTLQGIAGQTRMAVLNALDVSGNDYTSKLATYRSTETRIFSAGPSYGAFGPVSRLPAHVDEIYGGSVQVYDTIFVAQPTDPVEGFTTSIGVYPDQLVWQRQSDALKGVDTLIEAAKAWLTE